MTNNIQELDLMFRPGERTYGGVNARIFAQMVTQGTGEISTSFVRLRRLSTLSISSTITTIPLQALGSGTPLGITNGRRTIAGTFVFVDTFEDAFREVFNEYNKLLNLEYNKNIKEKSKHDSMWYDTFPNINLLIIITDERSELARYILITDIRLRDIGTTLSIHDLYTERTITYLACNIITTLGYPTYVDNSKEDIVNTISLTYLKDIFKEHINTDAGVYKQMQEFLDISKKRKEEQESNIQNDIIYLRQKGLLK